MAHIRTAPVVSATIAMLVVGATAVAWPVLAHRLDQWKRQRSIVAADDSTQWDIIRTYLEHERQRTDRVSTLYFDTKSAALCSLDKPEPCDRYEFISAGREGALVDRSYAAVPIELQLQLDRIALARTYNPDPRMPAVPTLANAEQGAFERACDNATPPDRPILIRISRAAVDEASQRGMAMVQLRFCDGSSRFFVASFLREGANWTVSEGDVLERKGRW
ncbi:hypothetical protein [Lysobacter panacisoli]|uniref:Uncharacterized protein n=1 Tax=Lysobacter panacisoli TaxID=1255263 RepID=A0ABP9LSV9_9GAMM|nr:hypothetical protein [Lysobacter panacisoli]